VPNSFEDSQHKICARECHHQPQPSSWGIRIPLFDSLFKTCIIQVALQAVTVASTDFEFNYTHELSHLTKLCLQQGGQTNHRASFRFTITVFLGV
jgi:hypothetical protein